MLLKHEGPISAQVLGFKSVALIINMCSLISVLFVQWFRRPHRVFFFLDINVDQSHIWKKKNSTPGSEKPLAKKKEIAPELLCNCAWCAPTDYYECWFKTQKPSMVQKLSIFGPISQAESKPTAIWATVLHFSNAWMQIHQFLLYCDKNSIWKSPNWLNSSTVSFILKYHYALLQHAINMSIYTYTIPSPGL